MTNLKSVSVTAADALIAGSATAMNDKVLTGAALKCQVETIEVTDAAEVATSTIRLFRVYSNWVIHAIELKCDTFATTGAVDIGLYKTAADGGAVVDADAYGSAILLTTAINTASVNHAFEARDVANVRKKVWEDAGLSADSNLYYDITLTVTTDLVTTAANTISAYLYYTDPN